MIAFLLSIAVGLERHVMPPARPPVSQPAAPAGSPVARHGALRVQRGRLRDAHGAPVTLRGMSLFWSQWMGRFYDARTVRWLRDDWGVTVVRAALAVEHDGYLAHPARERAKVERVIDAAVANGLYVIVDWHTHQPHTRQAAEFFAGIARKYGHLPNIIYEPWNEPLPEADWASVIKPHHRAVLARIRAVDSDNLVTAGTRSWSQDVDEAAADPIADANLAYTLHFYAGTHREGLRTKARAALGKGAALFVTEWGTGAADGGGELDEAETRRWWSFMETNGISYVNWSVADKAETTAALRPGAPTGGWSGRWLTASGRLVRAQLRDPR